MWLPVALLGAQFILATTLSLLNVAHLKEMSAQPPGEWAARLDLSLWPKMIAYTQARTRLRHAARLTELIVPLAILGSGLPARLARAAHTLPIGLVGQGLIVLAVLAAISYLADLPWEWISLFKVEKRFGFSTITVRTWLLDQLKTLLISAVLGIVLGGGMLWLIGQLGRRWWLPAWILFSLFQLLLAFIAPVLLFPLFNKFEPLRDEELAYKIAALAGQARFPIAGVYQIDASLRSTHSNAYLTGLGKTRRIALFDTLLDQHPHDEILAILAHEIGHWKKRHVLQSLVATTLASALAFALTALLLDTPWLYEVLGVGALYAELGVAGPVAAVGVYLVGILLSPLGLILSPLATWFSRRHEYEADAYALDLYNHPAALEEGLIRLSEKNLANLFPHPWVVAFSYSHPPLPERVAALRARAARSPSKREP
jgi:STE24 endopeptidase